MKKALLILAVLMANIAIAQSGVLIGKTVKAPNLQALINIPIEGMVEFDGHAFDNKKSKDPITFKATLEGITISDKNREYVYRRCSHANCEIVHLEKKSYMLTISNSLYRTNTLN